MSTKKGAKSQPQSTLSQYKPGPDFYNDGKNAFICSEIFINDIMNFFERHLIDKRLRLIEKPYVTANLKRLTKEPATLEKF